ncbi:MAG: sn-glycerol-3-phosphate import ATP-binding protein UgpC [Rhodospirillales bacterium]|jgi:sn-glycerol 3-phosphate transport system ATP-binding protein|nr:sn-glycerol-3-phosphate import ATP-binding protein UgpC [Rhodospirillales bacterium]
MAEVKLRDVRKSYGDLEVIHGVDCDIAHGELIVVVGPSGCGKSTVLRMIAGLEQISAGEISIGDKVVNNLEPAERDIAMVFQNYALYPHMTVYNNMAYGLKIRGMSKTEIDERVNKAAEILELGDYLLRKPRQLSGGQRQRVAMGRAIVREPAVFLFDEPLSNLDAKLRVQMRLEIKKLQQRLNITSVYVTHDQVEAMTLGDRLMVLSDGIVEQLGSPLELYDTPASVFVAGFIGSPAMNFLEGRIGEGGAAIELTGGGTLPISNGGASAHGGQTVTVGVRPEHFELADDGSADARVSVDVIEELGADTIIHGKFGKDDADLTVRLPGYRDAKTGGEIAVRVTPEHIHVFDQDTGKRLANT